MKILWIVPITGPDDADLKIRAAFVNNYLFPGTEVVFRKVERGTESIESRVDEMYATLPVLDEALKGEQEGFDACIIACAGDAGVAQAKELLRIPVVGPGESSILISQLIGRRVVFLTSLPQRIPSLEEKILRHMPLGQFFIYPTNIPVVEFRKDTGSTIEAVTSIIRRSVENNRVDTAILCCLSMVGMAQEVQRRVNIPVIDPALAAIEMAQILVKMNLSHAKGVYPFPPDKKRFL
ncbi:MAG: aspartate/glutamate racemase family protein [Desulfatiglandales bacterium]